MRRCDAAAPVAPIPPRPGMAAGLGARVTLDTTAGATVAWAAPADPVTMASTAKTNAGFVCKIPVPARSSHPQEARAMASRPTAHSADLHKGLPPKVSVT